MSRVNDGTEKRQRAVAGQRGVAAEAEFKGFLNPTLTEAQKKAFDEWFAGDDFWDVMEALTTEGLTFSVKWLPQEAVFVGTTRFVALGSVNSGWVVTMRGGSASKALGRVVYVARLLQLAGDWTHLAPPPRNKTDW